MTPELTELLDMLTFHAEEPEHVELAVDTLIAFIQTTHGMILAVPNLAPRQEMIDYVITQWHS